MDIIELAREIGRELQKDERYLNMRTVSAQCDKDEELQELIGEFNLKWIAIKQRDPERHARRGKTAASERRDAPYLCTHHAE